jgi:SHS2 domain-containing protein
MSKKINRFELLEHTGDLGLQVWSSSLEGIFATAAQGLFYVISELKNVEAQKRLEIQLEAESLEELFVRWLNHLNFLFVTEEMLFCRFDPIKIVNNTHLSATVSGESISMEKHEILREIKAVTYHQLNLKQVETGWFAQVIFDL